MTKKYLLLLIIIAINNGNICDASNTKSNYFNNPFIKRTTNIAQDIESKQHSEFYSALENFEDNSSYDNTEVYSDNDSFQTTTKNILKEIITLNPSVQNNKLILETISNISKTYCNIQNNIKVYKNSKNLLGHLLIDFTCFGNNILNNLENEYKNVIDALKTIQEESILWDRYHDFIVFCHSSISSIKAIYTKMMNLINKYILELPKYELEKHMSYVESLYNNINDLKNIIKKEYTELQKTFIKYKRKGLIFSNNKLTESEIKAFEKQLEAIKVAGYYENPKDTDPISQVKDTDPISQVKDCKENLNDYLQAWNQSFYRKNSIKQSTTIGNQINYILEQHYDFILNKIEYYAKNIETRINNTNAKQLNIFNDSLHHFKITFKEHIEFLLSVINTYIDKINTEKRFIEKLRFPAVAV